MWVSNKTTASARVTLTTSEVIILNNRLFMPPILPCRESPIQAIFEIFFFPPQLVCIWIADCGRKLEIRKGPEIRDP
jgi:hypothetical protein